MPFIWFDLIWFMYSFGFLEAKIDHSWRIHWFTRRIISACQRRLTFFTTSKSTRFDMGQLMVTGIVRCFQVDVVELQQQMNLKVITFRTTTLEKKVSNLTVFYRTSRSDKSLDLENKRRKIAVNTAIHLTVRRWLWWIVPVFPTQWWLILMEFYDCGTWGLVITRGLKVKLRHHRVNSE